MPGGRGKTKNDSSGSDGALDLRKRQNTSLAKTKFPSRSASTIRLPKSPVKKPSVSEVRKSSENLSEVASSAEPQFSENQLVTVRMDALRQSDLDNSFDASAGMDFDDTVSEGTDPGFGGSDDDDDRSIVEVGVWNVRKQGAEEILIKEEPMDFANPDVVQEDALSEATDREFNDFSDNEGSVVEVAFRSSTKPLRRESPAVKEESVDVEPPRSSRRPSRVVSPDVESLYCADSEVHGQSVKVHTEIVSGGLLLTFYAELNIRVFFGGFSQAELKELPKQRKNG